MNSKKMRNTYLITAILFIIAGIILLSWPQTTMNIICYGLGGLIFTYGGFQIYTYYNGKNEKTNYQMNLLTGLIACGIGLFMLMKSEIVISILPFIIGFTLLLESLLKFKHAYDLKKANYEGFKWIVVMAGVTFLFAGLLVYNPFDAVTSMVMFIGICLIFDGFSELWILYCITKYIQQKEEAVHEDIPLDKEQDDKDQERNDTTDEMIKEPMTKFVDITVDKDV